MATQILPFVIAFIYCALLIAESTGNQKVYIVYMGDLPKTDVCVSDQHKSMLRSVLGSQRASECLLRSYTRSFNGFVAKLTMEEKTKISCVEGVFSVFLSTRKQFHTTRSWDFMGFPVQAPRMKLERDIIIGMFDSGIWPESPSFNVEGYGPPPRKWKGICQSSYNFTCNNKIIGARYYDNLGRINSRDVASPRDNQGHGSHTASTAAGGLVYGANLFGFGLGTARGGVPAARIAVYKICWHSGCSDADTLAAFDDAIADGVDIISISVGRMYFTDYFNDAIAIGAFHAMKNGILTSNSAGNKGPVPESIINFSPWSLTVAANTIDRKFLTKVQLGNNKTYEGVSVNTFKLEGQMYPLVYGGNVPNIAKGFDDSISRFCKKNESLDPKMVKDTILLCDQKTNAEEASAAGAVGIIMQDAGFKDDAFSFLLPASYLGTEDGGDVLDYISKTSNPTATIFKSVEVKETSAPFVVSSSSRGPNPITRDILKPDVSAPGVDIIAAWSEGTTVTDSAQDKRVVQFNIISGTSMACPHATGAAAYVKSHNPTWSPAAIKSALMTTATPMSADKNNDAEFAYGSGQINPLKAKSPGLIYDISELDYIRFLCGQGYSNNNLLLLTRDNITCSETRNATVWDLNYPTFVLSETSVDHVFHRTVTNVGSPMSTYKAVVAVPQGLSIQVQPNVLLFTSLGQKQTFVVTVKATIHNAILSGSLVWDDGVHQVRSPVVAYVKSQSNGCRSNPQYFLYVNCMTLNILVPLFYLFI